MWKVKHLGMELYLAENALTVNYVKAPEMKNR